MEETKSPTTKPRKRTSKRKPFTDLSNTIPSSLPSSQSSSSSLLKPPTKSSLSLPLKSLFNNNPNANLNSNSKFTATQSTTNDNNHNDKKKETGPSNKANPSSTLSPPSKTHSVSAMELLSFLENKVEIHSAVWKLCEVGDLSFLNHFFVPSFLYFGSNGFYIMVMILGIGDCVDFEPCTVYNRRHTAEKRKSKGKEIAEPLSCSFEMRMPDLRKKRDGDGDIGLSKSCPMPCKKKQCREKAEVNASKHDLPQDFIDKQRAYFAEVDAFELEEEVASADELE